MTAPTPHFRAHHAVEPPRIDAGEFRPAWRVRTRLDQLLIDRTITHVEWAAAVRFRSMAETVAQQTAPRAIRAIFGGVHSGGKPDFAVPAAASRYCRDMHQRFGSTAYGILVACLVDDLSWTELGRRLGIDRRTARAWTVVLLYMLGKKTA